MILALKHLFSRGRGSLVLWNHTHQTLRIFQNWLKLHCVKVSLKSLNPFQNNKTFNFKMTNLHHFTLWNKKMIGKMFHNFEVGERIFMKLWHNVILINSERSWDFGGCGFIKPCFHALLKIGVLGLKSWSGPLLNLVTVWGLKLKSSKS